MLIPMESHVSMSRNQTEHLNQSQRTQTNRVKSNWDEPTSNMYKSKSPRQSVVHKTKSLPTQARCWTKEMRFKDNTHHHNHSSMPHPPPTPHKSL